MEKILLIDDDQAIHLLVQKVLGHYALVHAFTLSEAREKLTLEKFDLVLIDVNLPDGEGYSICEEIQKRQDGPPPESIFLTAKSELNDKLKGFAAGADDYITKPFYPDELKARVEGRLKKRKMLAAMSTEAPLIYGELYFEPAFQRVFWQTGSERKPLTLTPVEFQILYLLAGQKNDIVTREKISEKIWGDSTQINERTIDAHVCKLRDKLEGTPYSVRSVYGKGYTILKTAP